MGSRPTSGAPRKPLALSCLLLALGGGLWPSPVPALRAQEPNLHEAAPATGSRSPLAAESGSRLSGGGDRGLTLGELYELAARRNPRLSAMQAMVEAAEAMEASAGRPPDPMVEIGMMNFSLPDFSAGMPTSMAPSLRAMQMVPIRGQLRLQARIAEQTTGIRESWAEEEWWEVRAEVAMAFYELFSVGRELEVMRETVVLLRDFERVARAMYASGMGRQADVLRAGVEIARMDAEIERMETMGEVARANLNALLDRPADTPFAEAVYPALPATIPPLDTLRAWADASRPLLEGARRGVERAGVQSELARRELWPDLTVGVEYGRRSTAGMGVEHMGSVMVGFSVPVFARSRQLRMRDEAHAMERMAQAELTNQRAQVDARIAGLMAELGRTRALIRLFRTEILPQAQANVESAFSSYRTGAVDFMTLVDAQMSANEYDAQLYGLLAEYGVDIAELEMTLGRELPPGIDLIVEEP